MILIIINLASLRFCFISQLGFGNKLHAAFVCITRFNQPIFCRSFPSCLLPTPACWFTQRTGFKSTAVTLCCTITSNQFFHNSFLDYSVFREFR
ncbi:hypothetical protein I308_101149 [Cryptococcus tetragattii IND107]|uniref:Secreted protein n=1 Tax=Cryptococcus tetragattii IND107 TaxID=1296105 RepID=A0ABR3BZF9_9TREE